MDKVVDLSEGLAIKTIDNTAEILGIDLNNSENFKEKLEDIKNVLGDPKNKELMKDVVSNFAEVGVVALEAAKPFTNDLIEEISDKLKVVGNEFGETGVKVALNTLEEIPGYGIIIGTVRSASNIGEAILASTNATAEVVTKTSDTINASLQNFDNLLKEKGDLIDRTTESINKFSENMKSMPSSIPTTPSVVGGSRKHKRFKNKTKKVRFNL
jgi:ABC-type transporter Mla subunit MlaD